MRGQIAACLVAVCAATGAFAQQTATTTAEVALPIMVIDFDRVFNETLYGRRITQELSAERARVQAENDQLASELLAEEAELTAARATMEPEDFRIAAEAFNERAQRIRASREAESNRLVNLLETERAQFIQRIQPLIASLMTERGALVAMERRAVIVAIGDANATEVTIARIDSVLGDGRQEPGEAPTLRPAVTVEPVELAPQNDVPDSGLPDQE